MQQNHQSLKSPLLQPLENCLAQGGKVAKATGKKFVPSGDLTLPDFEDLVSQAAVDLSVLSAAALDWRTDPPDAEFKTVLDTPIEGV